MAAIEISDGNKTIWVLLRNTLYTLVGNKC